MNQYRVHVGYTSNGRNRWRRFATLAAAQDFCNYVCERTRIVLTIEQE